MVRRGSGLSGSLARPPWLHSWPMQTPLLDFIRFPGRRWSASFMSQVTSHLATETTLEAAVLARWSRHLNVPPNDMLLFATAEEAMRAAVHALVATHDVVLLARPLPPAWIAAVLQTGARYVDVGRRFDGPSAIGGWNADAAVRAAAAHPEAVAIAETASWTGAPDAATAGALPLRATIADARRTAACLGPVLTSERATLTLVALRDPDDPVTPVVHALIAPEGQGVALRVAVGPTALPQAVAERAFAVLDGLGRNPDWQHASEVRLRACGQAWHAALEGRPGVIAFAPVGLEAAALCLADDGEQIAAELVADFLTVRAWPMTPMRAILTVDLLRYADS